MAYLMGYQKLAGDCFAAGIACADVATFVYTREERAVSAAVPMYLFGELPSPRVGAHEIT